MPTSEFHGDDKPALDYIRSRGYASYSSMKNVRDCEVPMKGGYDEPWFVFGKELHSRLLENKTTAKLSIDDEKKLRDMLKALRANVVVQHLLADSINEIDFGPDKVLAKFKSKGIVVSNIYGLPMYGRIDIWNEDNVSDLKSTKCTNMKAFVESMDFLQAAIYLEATKSDDFFYLGICKSKPYNVMPFSVRDYPSKLKDAQKDLKRLCKYIKSKL